MDCASLLVLCNAGVPEDVVARAVSASGPSDSGEDLKCAIRSGARIGCTMAAGHAAGLIPHPKTEAGDDYAISPVGAWNVVKSKFSGEWSTSAGTRAAWIVWPHGVELPSDVNVAGNPMKGASIVAGCANDPCRGIEARAFLLFTSLIPSEIVEWSVGGGEWTRLFGGDLAYLPTAALRSADSAEVRWTAPQYAITAVFSLDGAPLAINQLAEECAKRCAAGGRQ